MKAALFFILTLLAIFIVYPVYFIVQQSVLVNGNINVYFIVQAFTDRGTIELLLRSLDLALMATAISAIISMPLAIILSCFRVPLSVLIQGLIIFPMILPPFVGAVGLRQMLGRFGPLNLILVESGLLSAPIDFLGKGGLFAVALTQALHLFPIMYLNLTAAILSRDPALEDAARTVGAGPVQTFFRITLPMVLPGFFAGAIIVFIWSFTDIGTPLVFRIENLLPVAVFNLRDQIYDQPQGYALSLLTLFVSSVLFVLARTSTGGLRGSATKGTPRAVRKSLSHRQSLAVMTAVCVLLLIALLPHAGVFLLSVSGEWFMTVIPSRFSFAAYKAVFTHPVTGRSIMNSLFLSAMSTMANIALGLTIAWILCRTKLRGRSVLDTVCMLPLAIPGVILAFAYLGAFSGTFLDPRVNPFPLLVAGYAMRRLPFMVRSTVAGLAQANRQLEEAAFTSGASPFSTFRRITFPLLLPHILAGAILTFAFSMLEVSESLLLAMENRFFPIAKAMYVLLARPDGLSLASALGILGMILTASCLIIAGRILGKDFGSIMRL